VESYTINDFNTICNLFIHKMFAFQKFIHETYHKTNTYILKGGIFHIYIYIYTCMFSEVKKLRRDLEMKSN